MTRIEVIATGPEMTPAALRAALAAVVEYTSAEAVLLWDPRLGAPDLARMAARLDDRGDVWHAGLLTGARGRPGLMDFVVPCWMFNADATPDREATSWRVSPAACLARTAVWRQLGLPCDDFDTIEAALLEWGHRAILRGALMRHVPDFVPLRDHGELAAVPTVTDEVRFICYRHGRKWARWAAMRAGLTGYAPTPALVTALARIGPRPYAEPEPYTPWAGGDPPDLAQARVTVLIPTLERYPYLHVVLEDLRAQTVRPHEIIIVDQTARERRDPAIAEKYPDLPLRVMYQDEPGQCVSRNAGLAIATGDYILFIDDDDELPPTTIEQHLVNLARHRADVSSGVAQELGTDRLPPHLQFTRASDVFPTNNTLIRRDVLLRSGLFDLAFNRAPRADGELGLRLYLSGAFMVLDQSNSVLHHHAPAGGLRVHKARVITYRSSRESLTQRHLPHISEIYLASRHFTERQRREMLWMRTFETMAGRGSPARRLVKAMYGALMLPDTIKQTIERRRAAHEWLERFPQIAQLER